MTERYRYGAINGAAGAGIRPILIGTPKRLEIAVTLRKQSSRPIPNRYKNRGSLAGATTGIYLLNLADGGWLRIGAAHQFVAAVREERAVDVVRAMNGFFGIRTGSGRAVRRVV